MVGFCPESLGLCVPTAPTHYHLNSPCDWHLGSGFWLEPCGLGPGHSCPFLPPSLATPAPRFLPPGFCLSLWVNLCLPHLLSIHNPCFGSVTSLYLSVCMCLGLSFGLSVPAYTCVYVLLCGCLPLCQSKEGGVGSENLARCACLLVQVCIRLSVSVCAPVCV